VCTDIPKRPLGTHSDGTTDPCVVGMAGDVAAAKTYGSSVIPILHSCTPEALNCDDTAGR
jgi:hypothetical protein